MTLDKSGTSVRGMFSAIAWRYDFLNHLLSANQDKLWRRRAVRRLCPRTGEQILDLCCGTGDLFLEIERQQPNCRVTGADFALPMLAIAREKAASGHITLAANSTGPDTASRSWFIGADALQLPFADQSFDAVAVAFGVRNFEITAVGLREMRRVLRPGGRLLILEFMRPRRAPVREFFALFNLLFAPVGRKLSGHASAYNYLPQSISGFYTRPEFMTLLGDNGFGNVRAFDHSAGVATSFLASKSG